jgi:glycosyltransferase involved in cell wall biosynthesis
VIPTFNRSRELGLCLEGFAQQTTRREEFEVIVVDDGSAESIAAVCDRFRERLQVELIRQENRGPSVARNVGIGRARAELLLLYDDDLRPLPDVVERCLTFHSTFPDEGDTALLYFSPDAEFAAEPFTKWAFPCVYPFPARAGVEDWKRFWSGTTTCKKSLFRHGQFNPEYRYLEDTEFALRLSCGQDLRVRFEPRMAGLMTRRLTLKQILTRQYAFGYFYYRMVREYPGLALIPEGYEPEPAIIHDRTRLRALLHSAEALGTGALTPQRYHMLTALWTRAAAHARAEGWIAAGQGRPAQPPGTIGAFLKE